MTYKERLEKLEKRIKKGMYPEPEIESGETSQFSILSGQKGAEKSLKDRLGYIQNCFNRLLDRIEKASKGGIE